MLSREELIKRGARFKDGSVVALIQSVPGPEPLVEAPTIDTTPIANAMQQLSVVVKTALDAQLPLLNKIVEQQSQPVEVVKPPEVWEFKIARDSKGRIESIQAIAMT